MKISFQTKAESNKQQQTAFLKLTPVERFYAFLELSFRLKDFPQKNKPKKSSENFVIKITDETFMEK